jgi:uncharacterized protein
MERIQGFLAERRLAMVGVSHDPADFSRALFREFRDRGYDIVGVNPAVPAGTEIDGQACFAHVGEAYPPVTAALLMTSPDITDQVVRECAAAGIRKVWMYRGATHGAVSEDAVQFCEAEGMLVVPGECPFMFLPGAMWLHRLHGVVRKISGTFPK